MRLSLGHGMMLTTVAVVLAACADAGGTTDPAALSSAGAGGTIGTQAGRGERQVIMRDGCDPTSFNDAFGPGTCVRNGGVTLDHFVAELTRNQRAGAWVNAPMLMAANAGQTLQVVNRGGETHTFTRVAQFGGGIIPFLNDLSGTTEVAPECDALAPTDFVPAGGTVTTALAGSGTEHFQCCIHPWMRTTVAVR